MVVTYWSVLVTVRMAQADTTETGMSNDASTMSTQEMIPLVRRARGFFSAISGTSTGATSVDRVSSGLLSVISARAPAVIETRGTGAHSLSRCSTKCVDTPQKGTNRVRIMGVSVIAGFFAPLVFVLVFALRKVNRSAKIAARGWNKRLQHEIARWT